MFYRERSAGIYRLSAYYLALMTVEAPMACVLPTMMVVIVYWMAGLTATAVNFIAFLLVELLNVFMSQVEIIKPTCHPLDSAASCTHMPLIVNSPS